MIVKKAEPSPAFFVFLKGKLFLRRSTYRTSVCARTAADALVSVDYVLAIALGDAAGGASVCASATADAFVRNFVCHLE